MATNYRPISLTSQLCKVFETIVRNQVIEFLESNVLIRNSHLLMSSFSDTRKHTLYLGPLTISLM